MAQLFHSPVHEGPVTDPPRGEQLPGRSHFSGASQAKWLGELIHAASQKRHTAELLLFSPGYAAAADIDRQFKEVQHDHAQLRDAARKPAERQATRRPTRLPPAAYAEGLAEKDGRKPASVQRATRASAGSAAVVRATADGQGFTDEADEKRNRVRSKSRTRDERSSRADDGFHAGLGKGERS